MRFGYSFVLLMFMLVVSSVQAAMLDTESAGCSARMIALGGRCPVDNQGIESIYENPGSLGDKGLRIGVSNMSVLDAYNYSTVGVKLTSPEGYMLGIGLQKMGVDGLFSTVESEGKFEVADTFSYEHFNLKLALGKQLTPRLSVGVGASYQQVGVGQYAEGEGYSLDVGMQYNLTDWLHLGIVADNILGNMKWEEGAEEDFGPSLTAGASVNFFNFVGIYLQATGNESRLVNYSGGVSCRLLDVLELRGSYQPIENDSVKETWINGGVGLSLGGIQLDYAYRYDVENTGNSYSVASVGLQL